MLDIIDLLTVAINSYISQRQGLCVLSLSRVWLFATPWTVTHQALLSLEFSKARIVSELPFPTPGDLPNPGIKHMNPPLASGFFTTSTTWEAQRQGQPAN